MKYLVFENSMSGWMNPSYTLMIFEYSFINFVLTELIVNSDIITDATNSWGTVQPMNHLKRKLEISIEYKLYINVHLLYIPFFL